MDLAVRLDQRDNVDLYRAQSIKPFRYIFLLSEKNTDNKAFVYLVCWQFDSKPVKQQNIHEHADKKLLHRIK